MNTFHDVLTMSGTATSAVAACDLVGFNDAKITADDAPVKGVAKSPADIGMALPIIVIGAVQVKASGPITAGARVISAATGGVKAAGATPVNPIGVATTAAADGELVMILLR